METSENRKKHAFIGRHLGFGQVWACLLELSFQVIYSSLSGTNPRTGILWERDWRKEGTLLSFQLKCSSNIDSIHYLGLTNSFDQVPRDIHTLPSIIVNFLLNSLNAPIIFVVCATNQS